MKRFGFKILTIILAIAILLAPCAVADSVYQATALPPEMPEISATSYVLADAKTGEVLFSQNENQRMPVASTTKVMTCLVALENSSPSITR